MDYATVLAVSVDSPYVLRAFAESNKLVHKVLSDVNREAVRVYNVFHETLGNVRSVVAKRSVFIIDKEGIGACLEIRLYWRKLQ